MASNDTTGTTGAMTSADYNAAWALVLMSLSATHYPSVASQHASTATASQSAPASSAATSQVALTARQAALRALNPSIDRSPAAINKSDSSKLQITINQNPPHGQKTHAYGKSVDWSNKWSVSALNDWRTKTFKSALGPLTQHTKRAPMVPMNQAEKHWVKWQGDRKGNQTWGGIARGKTEDPGETVSS